MAKLEIIRNGKISEIFDRPTKKSTLGLAVFGSSQAKAFAPVNKKIGVGGQLRNSIMWKTKNRKGGFNQSGGDTAENEIDVSVNEFDAVVGFNLLYGVYQEFGTRYMAPQPFLRPSFALARGDDGIKVLKKIQREEMRGSLSKNKVRETFL